MPVRSWAPFLIVTFAAGLIFHSAVLISLPVVLGTILGVAIFWQSHALDKIHYRRRFHYRRGFPGEQTTVTIEVENQKILPIAWLRTADPWPRAVSPDDPTIIAPSHIPDQSLLTHAFSLRWFERTTRKYTLTFHKRGYYALGPVSLASGDLFGMYEERKDLETKDHLTVFPELLPFNMLNLPTEDPFGDRRSRRRLFEDPNRPMGVREYQPDDDFRRVHWAATVHTGELQVKVYQPVSAQVLMICLNVATFPHYWEGIYPDLLEHLIKITATLASRGIQDGYSVGLISNGCLATADQPFHLLPGRSPQQLARILQALAEVTPFMTAPFEKFLLKSMPEIPYGATLVVVTALVSEELAEMLLRLRKYRRHLTLLSLEEREPPLMPGIRVIHLPFRE